MTELIQSADFKAKRRMLRRLIQDCKYYLGMGLRNSRHLWGKSVKDHIGYMTDLLNSLPDNEAPEWLTQADIRSFEERMNKTLVFSAVTLTAGGCEETFYVGGIPRDQDDITDSSGYDDFICDLEEGTEVKVHAEAYSFGEGETQAASHEELCEVADIERIVPDLLTNYCDNIEDLDFRFVV